MPQLQAPPDPGQCQGAPTGRLPHQAQVLPGKSAILTPPLRYHAVTNVPRRYRPCLPGHRTGTRRSWSRPQRNAQFRLLKFNNLTSSRRTWHSSCTRFVPARTRRHPPPGTPRSTSHRRPRNSPPRGVQARARPGKVRFMHYSSSPLSLPPPSHLRRGRDATDADAKGLAGAFQGCAA